ncbi:MAG: TetR/AcrR family transcriptional regulator [Caldisericaceae bacterium]|nr:TetR/AcrR family transcriptional regulator [Caldisericaceae bacterium]
MVDKALRKSKILEVAQNLFAKFGLAKTTIDDIAKMAHMGKASIYYYFTSKEAIFKEVVEKEGKILKEKLIEAVSSQNTPQGKLRSYLITRMTAIKDLANYYSALREEYLKHYSFIEKARHAYDSFEITMISTILSEGQNKGILDIEDITLAAETFVAAMKGMEYQWSMEGSKEEIIEKIDVLLKILFKGIEKRN